MTMEEDFKDVKNAVTSALIETTKVAGQISNEDLTFYRSYNPSIVPLLEKQNARLLRLARSLTRIATLGTELPAPPLKDVESVDDNWRSIVDVFDKLLEKADACLDEFTGSIKRLSPGQEEQIKSALPAHGKQRPGKAYRNQNIPKPQLLFANIPRNDDKSPFKPLLKHKPHAIVPLQDSLAPTYSEEVGSQESSHRPLLSRTDAPPQTEDLIGSHTSYRHPYETEIRASRYPPSTFVKSEPIPYLPYLETKATLVDTPEAVAAMLAELKKAKEIAIDLEHHDEHSYIGLVSLMQISTREKDWIVDTLKPWRQDLQVLNEVFADPNILKVLHGAFMDVIWLQRDLGLYVVGLFDTFHASRRLGYPRNSLAYLLKHFADFDAAKQYQMADWRIRPLPEAMFDYARSDTHFLLYVYDNMRNELIDKSNLSQTGETLIETVMNNSKEEALQKYERPFYDYEKGSGGLGWYTLLRRTPTLFNREQFAVFRAVHQWRDELARQEDEGLHLIMPKHVLYNIAREMPMDMPSLLACSHPMSKPFVQRKEDLLGVVKRAKTNGASGPDMKELMHEVDPFLGQKASIQGNADEMLIKKPKADSPSCQPAEKSLTPLVLRCENSRFWGSSLSDTITRGPAAKAQELSLALPLPQLTAEVFEDTNSPGQSRRQGNLDPGPSIEPAHVPDRPSKRDEIIIVKQDGGSRKRKAASNPRDTEHRSPQTDDEFQNGEAMEISLHADANTDIDHKRERAERKAEKKRQKRERTEQHQASGTANTADEATEAFDYASAPSVLHSKRTAADHAAAAAAGKGGVNPYAKSMDAPKGMRKSRKEIAGKSHTFRN